MKNKILKRMFAMLLAATMIVSVGACGNKKENDDLSGKAGSAADANATYPLDTDVELSFWCGSQVALADDVASWQLSPFHSGLEEKTGVTVDWKWVNTGTDAGQAYQLLWVDTELPNIVFYNISQNEASDLLSDGLIWDLTEYLPKYAPNYWAWLNEPENEAELQAVRLSDGSFYSVASVKEDVYNQVYIGPVIRQDWLDECNLKAPVTLEDWENVLLTFKEKYGATLSFTLSSMKACGGIASGTGSYGFANTAAYRVDDEGNVVIPQITPEYAEMMEVLARWWKLGLIDSDCLSASDDSVRQKALSGKAGIIFTRGSQCELIISDAEKEENGANWVGIEYPRTAAGEPTTAICIEANRTTGYHAVITTETSEDELIAALRWLDYGWTEEGALYWNFGEEGVSYTLDEDGNPQWTDLVLEDSLGANNGRKKYCGVTGSGPVNQLLAYAKANNNELMDATINAWAANTVAAEHMLPSLEQSEEDQMMIDELWTPISTYINEESLKILTGEKPISEIDSFVDKLYDMGLQDVLDIKQKYYDEYIK